MKKPPLGEQELEVLSFVTDHAPISIGAVAQHFAETQGLARTTILTVMERLRKKAYLTRKQQDGVFLYSPAVTKAELLGGLVQDFVEKTLSGSVSPFVAYLARANNITDQEIVQIKQMLEELESSRQSNREQPEATPKAKPQRRRL